MYSVGLTRRPPMGKYENTDEQSLYLHEQTPPRLLDRIPGQAWRRDVRGNNEFIRKARAQGPMPVRFGTSPSRSDPYRVGSSTVPLGTAPYATACRTASKRLSWPTCR